MREIYIFKKNTRYIGSRIMENWHQSKSLLIDVPEFLLLKYFHKNEILILKVCSCNFCFLF